MVSLCGLKGEELCLDSCLGLPSMHTLQTICNKATAHGTGNYSVDLQLLQIILDVLTVKAKI